MNLLILFCFYSQYHQRIWNERFTLKSGEFSFWLKYVFPTLLVILIAKSLQIEVHNSDLLLKPLICRKSHAITPKCHNSCGSNFKFSPFLREIFPNEKSVIVFWLYLFYRTFKITIYSVRPLPFQLSLDKNFQFLIDFNHLNEDTIF